MKEMLLGANAIAALTVALFFLRFWRNTRDRFFIFFALAFLIDAIVRIALGLGHWSDHRVKGFAMSQRMNAVNTFSDFDDFVTRALHRDKLAVRMPEAKRM